MATELPLPVPRSMPLHLAGCFFSALCAALALAKPPSGTWSTFPALLPALQLPAVPLAGNGHIGIALDSHASGSARVGPGAGGSIDLWLGSTSFWSCTSCGAVDPDRTVPACCSTAALGGLSLRPPPALLGANFSAEQELASGTLRARLTTAAGGVLLIEALAHPSLDAVLVNLTWSPAPGDPPALAIAASLWVLGDGSIGGSWNTGVPAPASVGCAAAGGAPEPCSGGGGGSQFVFASRNASTVDAIVMPVSAALAAAAVLSGGAAGAAASVTSRAAWPAPWEATLSFELPAGAWAAVLVAEAETRGPGLTDPVPAALAALGDLLVAPGGAAAVADAAAAFWAEFWSRATISLPSRPRVEDLWFGCQYVLATGSSARAGDAAPGLYGPWVTADGPNWHGDYT